MRFSPSYILAFLAAVFLVLNFTVQDAGTIFLLLAAVCAVAAVFTAGRGGKRG